MHHAAAADVNAMMVVATAQSDQVRAEGGLRVGTPCMPSHVGAQAIGYGLRVVHRRLPSHPVSNHAKEKGRDQHRGNKCEHTNGIHGLLIELGDAVMGYAVQPEQKARL